MSWSLFFSQLEDAHRLKGHCDKVIELFLGTLNSPMLVTLLDMVESLENNIDLSSLESKPHQHVDEEVQPYNNLDIENPRDNDADKEHGELSEPSDSIQEIVVNEQFV